MNILDLLDAAVSEQLQVLTELRQVRYAKATPSALKQRRSLGIKVDSAEFEILVWESGEVEYGYGTVIDSRDEHLVLSSQSDLDELLARFIQTARSWP